MSAAWVVYLKELVDALRDRRTLLMVLVSSVAIGPVVLMLASLGRSARDFDDLAGALAAAGYTVIRPEPRGIGGSTGRTSTEALSAEGARAAQSSAASRSGTSMMK